MLINRRTWLGGLAGAVTAVAVTVPSAAAATIVAPGATPGFRAALNALADFATADLTVNGFPGMTIAVRAADGQTATLTLGVANLTTREAVRADHLFQIGSISKSFVALALYALAGQGRLDLDAPVTRVVPELWLDDRSITIAQLLAHSAGLPDNSPVFPDVPGGRLWSATPPGAAFSYSNAGYDLLAFVVERASGRRFDAALDALVLRPLGMAHAEPVIRSADRGRYAQGYVPFGEGAWFARAPLAEGPWLDIDRAAGSVAATSGDMLRYIAFIGQLAQGRGAPLFNNALARRFATPVIDAAVFGKGARYGSGLATVDIDGAPAFHHTGGMLVFSSSVHVDRASGAGVFASVNIGSGIGYRPRQVSAHGVRLLRALAASSATPSPPAIAAPPPLTDANDFAGRFVGPAGEVVTLTPAAGGLMLDGRWQLRSDSDGSLVTDRDYLGLHFSGTGRRDRLWRGATLYGRDAALPQPPSPPALAALAGVYLSNDPWVGGTAIYARGDALVAEGGGALTRSADGSWRAADAVTERTWFDRSIDGRPQRLNQSGNVMWRFAG